MRVCMQELEGASAKCVKCYLPAVLAGGPTGHKTKRVYARLADEVINQLLQVC